MKTIRLFGIALITVLLCVGLSSCSKSSDDDDNGGGSSSASIEGTWYLRSVIWYDYYPDGTTKPINDTKGNNRTYADYADDEVWVLTKNGENVICKMMEKGFSPETVNWEKVSINEYKCKEGNTINKIVIKSVSDNKMVLEWYDCFYNDLKGKKGHEEGQVDMGVYTFLRK